jgi:hypothetical protein
MNQDFEDDNSHQTEMTAHHRFFEEARNRLAIMEKSTTCKRMATTKLLASCEQLQIQSEQDNTDGVEQLYAVRLAMCEIGDATIKSPHACRLEVLPGTTGLVESLDQQGKEKLKGCISALHSKSQWWTSYSNNRRDAYLWCKAMQPGFDQGM